MAGLLLSTHYIFPVPELRTVAEVLATAQRFGTLGDWPIPQVIEHARQFVAALPPDAQLIIDIGTGAGVPGLVIAQDCPELTLVLVDRRTSRMDALARGVAAAGMAERVQVLTAEVDDLGKDPDHIEKYDVVVCRGFGSPEVTATLARPLLKNGGSLIVSEPPSKDPSRWPSELLNKVGFEAPEHLPGVVRLRAKAY